MKCEACLIEKECEWCEDTAWVCRDCILDHRSEVAEEQMESIRRADFR